MNKLHQRQVDRLKRVAAFFAAHESDFAEGSRARQLANDLGGVLSEVETQGSTGTKTAKSSAGNKKALLNDLREELVAIEKTARAIETHNPEFEGKFVLPDKRKKEGLADAARDFANEAEPVKEEFLSYEMRPDFLEVLNEKLAAYEAAQTPAKPVGRGRRGPASNETLDRGTQLFSSLEVIVGNKYRGNAEVLGEWTAATTGVDPTRRRRGRPATRKAAAPSPDQPRRRGRPRKNAV